MQQSDELKLAIEAAKKAEEIIKNGYGQKLEITVKENLRSIVTQIDKQSEKAIINILKSGSSYPILAEESGKSGELGDTFWVIDPLDGTTNFSRGIPFFCVSIALVKNNQVVLGVTLNPLTGDLYFAEEGQGAYVNDKQVKVSQTIEGALVILNEGISEESGQKYIEVTKKLRPNFILRRLGSSCLELAYVASGITEGMVSFGDKPWDMAAGSILIKEAGGRVTDWQGSDWTIKSEYMLASNGLIHQKIKESIDSI